MNEARNRSDGGRLAGSVGADQRGDLAVFHFKIDPLEGVDGAVIGMDAAQFEGRRFGRILGPGWLGSCCCHFKHYRWRAGQRQPDRDRPR